MKVNRGNFNEIATVFAFFLSKGVSTIDISQILIVLGANFS